MVLTLFPPVTKFHKLSIFMHFISFFFMCFVCLFVYLFIYLFIVCLFVGFFLNTQSNISSIFPNCKINFVFQYGSYFRSTCHRLIFVSIFMNCKINFHTKRHFPLHDCIPISCPTCFFPFHFLQKWFSDKMSCQSVYVKAILFFNFDDFHLSHLFGCQHVSTHVAMVTYKY